MPLKVTLATIHAFPQALPLALMYLQATLVERHGHPLDHCSIVELDPQASPDALARQLALDAPDVVGFSCYIWNGRTLLAVARELKRLRPQTRIVLGGPEVGPIAESVLTTEPVVDVIVRGEGELAFAQVIDAWTHGRSLDAVEGICFRSGNQITTTPDATILRDLNELPSPHQERFAGFEGRVAAVETQRGCVFRCHFCFYNKDLSIRNRRFNLDRVQRELLFWLNRDVHSIFLMDPVFNLNAVRAKEICRFIAAHNHRGIRIHSEIWAEFMDDELAALMKAANFSRLEVGLQTTDDVTLQAVERRLRLPQFLDGIAALKRHGLYYELQLIYGLPHETAASFRRSLDFAASLEPPELSVFMLLVLPGTELWKEARALGVEFDPDPPYRVRAHPSMDAATVEEGERIVEAVNFFRTSRTIRILRREPGISLSAIVDAWNQWRAGVPTKRFSKDAMRAFMREFCTRHGVASSFYETMIDLETEPGPLQGGRLGATPGPQVHARSV